MIDLEREHDQVRVRRIAPIARREDLAFAYPGFAPVLDGLSFQLQAGEVVALTGCNGAGKTTLLKLLCGLLRSSHGRLTIAGRTQPAVQDLAGIVGLLFQNPDEQLFTDSVAAEIEFGPGNLGRGSDTAALVGRIGLSQHGDDQLRGAGGRGRGSATRRFRLLVVPLVTALLRSARQIAMAAEVRAYSARRVPARQLRFSARDWFVLLVLCALAVVGCVAAWSGGPPGIGGTG